MRRAFVNISLIIFVWSIDILFILLHWKAIFWAPHQAIEWTIMKLTKPYTLWHAQFRRFNQFWIPIKSLPQTKGHKYLQQFEFSKWIKIIIIFGWFVDFCFHSMRVDHRLMSPLLRIMVFFFAGVVVRLSFLLFLSIYTVHELCNHK